MFDLVYYVLEKHGLCYKVTFFLSFTVFSQHIIFQKTFFCHKDNTSLSGTPTLTCVPFVPVVIFAPRGPMLTLVLFFPKFTRTPGNIFIDFLKNVVISIGLSFAKIVPTEGNEARFNC